MQYFVLFFCVIFTILLLVMQQIKLMNKPPFLILITDSKMDSLNPLSYDREHFQILTYLI